MAGRPKRMAAKLAELEQTAYQLSGDVGKLCPGAYREWRVGWNEDDYGAVWFRAVAATKVAADAVNYLLALCEERAFGVGEGDDRDMVREVKRGLWPPPGVEVPERIRARLQLDPSPSDSGTSRTCAREG